MNKTVSVNLFISVYKNIFFLKKVLDSVEQQNYKNFIVTILEDGEFDDMREFINNVKSTFPIFHFSQKDLGFRKNKILNAGLRKNTAELCVFIDGDCVLHPKFLYEYVRYFDGDSVLFGKRTYLDQKTSALLLNTNIIVPSKWTMYKNKSKHVEESFYLPFKPVLIKKHHYLIGSNMGIPFSTLKAVNGFDEDFTFAGFGEDCDIEWRIANEGFSFLNLKHHAIQFHLDHERANREEETEISRQMFERKKREGFSFCKHGLD
jgi:cellulose synthase/poly-beta-1,6-N-acetylglucosamine synthase-like glycosyltransferase